MDPPPLCWLYVTDAVQEKYNGMLLVDTRACNASRAAKMAPIRYCNTVADSRVAVGAHPIGLIILLQ